MLGPPPCLNQSDSQVVCALTGQPGFVHPPGWGGVDRGGDRIPERVRAAHTSEMGPDAGQPDSRHPRQSLGFLTLPQARVQQGPAMVGSHRVSHVTPIIHIPQDVRGLQFPES